VTDGRPGGKRKKGPTPKKADAARKGPAPKKAKKPRAPMPPGREARPPRAVQPDVTLADPSTGRGIVYASYAGTVVLLVTAVAAVIAPHTFDIPAFVAALVLFFGGIAIFAWAFLVMAGRSRSHELTLSGVFGLSQSTPGPVKAQLFGSLAAQTLIAVATAATRLYSTLSFGVLAVMWGLGLAGLWGARYGAFPPRVQKPPQRRRKSR
jgi:hypothetical protein